MPQTSKNNESAEFGPERDNPDDLRELLAPRTPLNTPYPPSLIDAEWEAIRNEYLAQKDNAQRTNDLNIPEDVRKGMCELLGVDDEKIARIIESPIEENEDNSNG